MLRTADELQLRGTDAGAPCVIAAPRTAVAVRRHGVRGRGRGRRAAARRRDRSADPQRCRRPSAASRSTWPIPSGIPVRVVAGHARAARAGRASSRTPSTSATSCAAPTPPSARRASPPGCSGSGTSCCRRTKYIEALNWYLDNLGMIVSDFLYYPGQRDRGPAMSFIRCDRGSTPADHHTLAMALGPANRYVHSAYQVVRPRRAGRRR